MRYDTYFVLKALLDPNNPMLQFLGLPDDNSPYIEEWRRVFTEAAQTPQGRARLALAFTMTQWNMWGVGLPRPDPQDLDQFQNHIRELAIRLHQPHVNTQFLFETQVGVWIGNDGADYAKYWQNGDPLFKKAVRELYEAAGPDLDAEIQLVNAAPRTPTNRTAAAFWLSHNARTQRGTPQTPVFRFHTIGDPQVVVSQVQVYTDEVNRNGKTRLYRTAFVERQGHCSFTVAEAATAMEVMMRRLDTNKARFLHHTGYWPSTTPEDLNLLAASLNTGTQSAFIHYHLRKFNGEWRLDQSLSQ